MDVLVLLAFIGMWVTIGTILVVTKHLLCKTLLRSHLEVVFAEAAFLIVLFTLLATRNEQFWILVRISGMVAIFFALMLLTMKPREKAE